MYKRIVLSIGLLILPLLNLPVKSAAQTLTQQVVMIIASNNFRDEELFLPKEALEQNGIRVILASSSLAPARGMLGKEVKPDILLNDVKIDDYTAVIFVGGSGAEELWDNPWAQKIALEAQAKKKLVAAICIAPLILAKAGVLQGRKATIWPGLAKELETLGAEYTGKDLEIDGNIITANGPQAAEKFAAALVQTLLSQK